VGNGGLLESTQSISRERNRAAIRTIAKGDSSPRHDGHLTHLRVSDHLVVSGCDKRNAVAWWFATSCVNHLIEHSVHDERFEFRVYVVPRASRSEVVGEHNGALRVRIAAPPVDGAANEELIRILAKTFGVPKSEISIVSGLKGRSKHVQINARFELEKLIDVLSQW